MNSQIRFNQQKYLFPFNYDLRFSGNGWILGSGWIYTINGLNQPNIKHVINTNPLTCKIKGLVSGMKVRLIIFDNAYVFGNMEGTLNYSLNGLTGTTTIGGSFRRADISLTEIFDENIEYDLNLIPSNDNNTMIRSVYFEVLNNRTEYLDLNNDIFNLSFQVQDIRDPSTRKTGYTKNLTTPKNLKNLNIFNNLQSINAQTELNDKYFFKELPSELLYKNDVVDKGYTILKEMSNDLEIEFKSKTFNLISSLGNDYIFGNENIEKDIDVSDLLHYFTKQTIVDSWYNPTGYTYKLIDYTLTDPSKSNLFYMVDLKPQMYVSYLLDKIIKSTGFNLKQTQFINSDLYKNLIIPWTGANIQSPTNWLNLNRETYVYRTGLTYSTLAGNSSVPYIFTSVYTDLSNQYVAGVITILNTGTYGISSKIKFETTNITNYPGQIYTTINRTPVGSTTQQIEYTSNKVLIPGQGPGVLFSVSGICSMDTELELNAGDKLVLYFNTSGFPTFNFTYNQSLETTYFRVFPKIIVNKAKFNDLIDMSYIFGNFKYKKLDFLMDLVRLFNLIIDYDKQNPKDLILETNDVYYSGGTYRDWTNYVDYKTETITRLPELVNKSFYLSYQPDTDTPNKWYSDFTKTTYGEKYVYNELKSKDYIKINTILSPTPLLIKSSSDIIVSAIYEKDTSDDTNQKVLVRDFNPRILYSKNIPLTNGKTIVLRDPNYPNAGDITLGEIYNINFQPYCGHLDDPYNPTLDLNFGNNPVYFINLSGITSNNLSYLYYENYLDQILDHDSKLVSYQIKIPFNEIKDFSLGDTIRIKNTNYIINKIIDWNPDKFCKIELIKLSNNYLRFRRKRNYKIDKYNTSVVYPPTNISNGLNLKKPSISPGAYAINDVPVNEYDMEVYPGITYDYENYYDKSSNLIVIGKGNHLNNALNSYIIGDDNYIAPNKEDIISFGKNNRYE